METINERFKLLRKECRKNQTEWGKILGIQTSGVSDIESGRRNVTEQHLIMLSNWKEYQVNMDWLRTGQGEKFKVLSDAETIAEYVSELLEDDGSNPVYGLIKEMMKTYIQLDQRSQEVINNACQQFIEGLTTKKEG